jgi:hypothetical protein
MEEQPLSAALLVADVRNPTFDGSCNNAADIFGPPPCDVRTWTTGLRNMYDFVFHSNGSIYGPDNGLGVVGTYPPKPTPPCLGFGDTRPYTQGGNNPGEQPDLLVRLQEGKYNGHPNPRRNECVFKDGSFQAVAPLPNYEPPLYNLGAHKSADGTIEYLADASCGALKGEILIANYSVGDDITRIRLSADGKSVASAGTLIAAGPGHRPRADIHRLLEDEATAPRRRARRGWDRPSGKAVRRRREDEPRAPVEGLRLRPGDEHVGKRSRPSRTRGREPGGRRARREAVRLRRIDRTVLGGGHECGRLRSRHLDVDRAHTDADGSPGRGRRRDRRQDLRGRRHGR